MAEMQSRAALSADEYLKKNLGRTLRVTTTDGRVFVGQMKCTDRESNIILALTQEYRPPSDAEIKVAVAVQATTTANNPNAGLAKGSATTGKVNVQFTNRYVGLVVVPGKHITKIEYEQWAGLS